jgi:FkbM family methyltransferase
MKDGGIVRMLRDLRAWLFDRYAQRSYSQEGEDMILRRLFDGRHKGLYVDVGAHHPMRFSNTYFFYRQGWRGINIEPNPDAAPVFRLLRRRDIHVQAGVGAATSVMRYWCFDEPALNTFDEALMRERVSRTHYRVLESRMVAVDRLDSILGRYLPGNQKIDFMSIDVEGRDLQVLQSNDWARFRPTFVLVEALGWQLQSATSHPVDLFMRGVGYAMVAKTLNTLIYGQSA